jgi:hypothetical protein
VRLLGMTAMHEISSTFLEQDWSVEIIEELVGPKMH